MNGKAEWWRFFGGLVLAGIVGYFSALGAQRERIAVLEDRVQALQEVSRNAQPERVAVVEGRVQALADDVRDIKADVRTLVERSYAGRGVQP